MTRVPMTAREIASARVAHQLLGAHGSATPEEVVSSLGAMQAQDYVSALWSVGVRTAHATQVDVERALAERKIVRTWPLRGTLHVVAAADVHWMLELLAERQIAASARRRTELGLDDRTLGRCRKIVTAALEGGRQLTREALYEVLERTRISTAQQRGYHILFRLALDRLICFGPQAGRQPTFVLLDEWVPPPRRAIPRETALARLAERYFTSHGPANLADFAGWAGLGMTDARAGLELVEAQLRRETYGETTLWTASSTELAPPAPVHLLPAFDEFVLGYKDRSATLDSQYTTRIVPGGNGVFLPAVLVDGHVVGTWKRSFKAGKIALRLELFGRIAKTARRELAIAAERYGRFLGTPVELTS